ncbi:MAG: HNH endonuclease [Mycobacterium sp.]|nr:HNH endonuclease [Mycobacterium sp.]
MATEVHHIIEQVFSGTDDDDNLISLCEVCHERKTVALRQELNKRRKAELKEQKRRSHPGYLSGDDGT